VQTVNGRLTFRQSYGNRFEAFAGNREVAARVVHLDAVNAACADRKFSQCQDVQAPPAWGYLGVAIEALHNPLGHWREIASLRIAAIIEVDPHDAGRFGQCETDAGHSEALNSLQCLVHRAPRGWIAR
jgi:hypothetical protein